MRRAAVASAVLALALALSGCGGGSSDDGGGAAGGETTTAAGGAEGELSVAQAREAGGAVTVRGYIHVLTTPMLCNGLDTSSFPPACVGPTLKISNPAAIADVQLEQGQGTEFARKPVTVTGTVNDDSITVEEVSTE
jgi:hypothetical protein